MKNLCLHFVFNCLSLFPLVSLQFSSFFTLVLVFVNQFIFRSFCPSLFSLTKITLLLCLMDNGGNLLLSKFNIDIARVTICADVPLSPLHENQIDNWLTVNTAAK